MITRQSIDQVINTAVVEEVIGDFVTLKKRGVNMIGNCPFHDEKTPSFIVSPTKGIYKCFGCGKAGNSVAFIMEHEQLGFPDAIRYLARKYNIELEEDNTISKEELDEASKQRESILIVLEFAKNYYQQLLQDDVDGRIIGKGYFKERGFTEQTIQTFGLGYARNTWDSLVNEAVAKGYNLQYMEAAGLVKKRENQDSWFDMFRDRVIFPIHGANGKVIAFAGRQLKKDDKGPKYLNSPETEVYHKSDVLYGMYFAKKEIKKQNNCYLVEGYTDVITLYQGGVENVVASSGTSLTDGQIKLIKRFTDNVTVLYDGDFAGIKASLRGTDMLLERGLNVRVVTFPEGEDPDSYCQKLGPEPFRAFLQDNANDFILFKSNLLMQDAKNDPIKRAEATRDILHSISLIPDTLKRSMYARECARLLDTDEKILFSEMSRMRRQRSSEPSKQIEEQYNEILKAAVAEPEVEVKIEEEQERALIRLLIQSGERLVMEDATVADFIFKELELDEALEFKHPLYRKILEESRATLTEHLSISQHFFVNHPDTEISALAAELLTERHELSPYWAAEQKKLIPEIKDNYISDLQSVFRFLKLNKLNLMIDQAFRKYETIETEEEKAQYYQYIIDLIAVRNLIALQQGSVIPPGTGSETESN